MFGLVHALYILYRSTCEAQIDEGIQVCIFTGVSGAERIFQLKHLVIYINTSDLQPTAVKGFSCVK